MYTKQISGSNGYRGASGSKSFFRRPFNPGSFRGPKKFHQSSYSSNSTENSSYNTKPKPNSSGYNQNRRPFNRFSSGGNSNFRGRNQTFNTRGFKGGWPKSKLTYSDPNIFIKKAEHITQTQDQVLTQKFTDLPISNPLKENISRLGFINLTPIQNLAIQPILDGRDLIGLANTGTGKTAAFLVPIIDKIFTQRNQKALIVAPTRELATQINSDLKNLSFGMRIYSALAIGGTSMGRQIFDLRRNPHVVIGTPGRLKDHIERKNLNLSDFSIFVLDEVDLMVDIGFINDIKYFLSFLPQIRQSLFFSATISEKIKDILNAFVKDPVTASITKQGGSVNVDQDIVKVQSPAKKLDQLHDLLIQDGFDKVLVFGRTKHGIEKLNQDLETRGFKVKSIHGNKSQGQRQRTLDSFKRNEIQILLATDVASRGLDIPNVTHVINYDLPETYEDYIHRIGRTGRADKKGTALTFVE